ncbi:DUF4288 domain-containing protein [Algoriphagus yeomjeoni]|uniref:Uncharacterized protein DUF4288 n=1 Tax=Algoriphagus yeomjeoni TaxID=291403 RepID=A0A327PYS7_9BACT|nr:DUF4288 domain-containing protein [Algoriphagus yeomjeoni]RAI94786.1 uncharacterized protein DUF4288 [Algoriphagus yeomjeoni]
MKFKILGIENINELDSYPEIINVRIHLKYPDYMDILYLAPKKRLKVIRQRQRDNFKEFVKEIKEKEYIKTGTNTSPSGLELTCSKKELLDFTKNPIIDHIAIASMQELADLDYEPIELYFAVKTRFAIQIENREKGLQDYEDRILLIKATSVKDAEKKLIKGFEEYEKPYINGHGELVRWKFEEFSDWYETSYSSLDDMLEDEQKGIEIFSVLKSRRLNCERMWKRENEK